MNVSLDNIKKEGTKWEDKYRMLESRYKEIENNHYVVVQEKDKISNTLRAKTFELEEVRAKFNKL